MLHTVIILHPALYWSIMFLLIGCLARGWYHLGATNKMVTSQRNYTSFALRFRPFAQRFDCRIANLALSAQLESTRTRIAAAIEMKIQ
jgi:hypothetical protein